MFVFAGRGQVLLKIGMLMVRFVEIGRVCFELWKFKISVANKMFCDCLDKLIVCFSAIPVSHKCLDYNVLHCCVQGA